MVKPRSGETDSLEVVATGLKYVNCKYTRLNRLKLICDGPELKTLCYYIHINVILLQKCFDILDSGLDAHDCE